MTFSRDRLGSRRDVSPATRSFPLHAVAVTVPPMEPDRAIEIVQALADGVDPYTGERFPSDSPYQQADTVSALHLALEGLTKLRRSTARKTGPGRPWTEDEEKVKRHFEENAA